MNVRGFRIVAVALGCLVPGFPGYAVAFPVDGNQTTLPVTTELNEDALDKPREVFRSESSGGGKSIWSISAIWLSVRRQFSAAWRDRPA